MERCLMLLNATGRCSVARFERLQQAGLDAEDLLSGKWERLAQIGVDERTLQALETLLATDWLAKEMERCQRREASFVSCLNPLYPQSLLDLKDAPLGLYCHGGGELPGTAVLGIVGTRSASPYGLKVAQELGARAAKEGRTVISGGARGIDVASHLGCLQQGGITFSVLGSGLDILYPTDNVPVFHRIAAEGLIISEYPFGMPPLQGNFLRRNRLIAALSRQLIVVEAPQRSGATNTAGHALALGRDLWVVPGRIGDEKCQGSNRLIFDGALPLIAFDDFFELTTGDEEVFEVAPRDHHDWQERMILTLLTDRGDRTVDNLACEAKMSAAEVFQKMSVMLQKGLVVTSGPGRYSLP